jgi:hypothetical protein
MLTGSELAFWGLAAAFGAAFMLAPWFGLVALGVVTALPFLPTPPGDLPAFGSPWIAIPALLLGLAGVLVQSRPTLQIFWDLLHTPVRLALPCMVLFLAVSGNETFILQPPVVAWGQVLLALAVATALLMVRWGWIVVTALEDRPAPFTQRRQAWGLEALGASLALVAVGFPLAAGGIALVLTLTTVSRSRRAVRAAPATPHLLRSLVQGPTGGRGWRGLGELPRWLRGSVAGREGSHPGNPGAGVRGTPAVLQMVSGSAALEPAVRTGWLLVEDGEPRFVFQGPMRIWEIPLASATPAPATAMEGPLLQRVEFSQGTDRMILGIGRDGPSLRDLQREFTRSL